MGLYWHLKAVKRALGPLIFRLKKHKIHHQLRNLITIRHANFEFSTLRTVGGVGFRDKQINKLINKHSDFYVIRDFIKEQAK